MKRKQNKWGKHIGGNSLIHSYKLDVQMPDFHGRRVLAKNCNLPAAAAFIIQKLLRCSGNSWWFDMNSWMRS